MQPSPQSYLKTFHYPEKQPTYIRLPLIVSSAHQPWKPIDGLSLWICPLRIFPSAELHIHGILLLALLTDFFFHMFQTYPGGSLRQQQGTSFLSTTELHPSAYILHLVYLFISGWISNLFLFLLATTNNADVVTVCKFSWGLNFSVFLGLYLGSGFLGHTLSLCLAPRTDRLLSSVIASPPTTSLLLLLCLSYSSHLPECKVVSHWGLDLHFRNDVECLFMCLLGPLGYLQRWLFYTFAHF